MAGTKAPAALLAVFNRNALEGAQMPSSSDSGRRPDLLRLPGFLSAQVWSMRDAPTTAVVLCDLSDVGVVSALSPAPGDTSQPSLRRVISDMSTRRYVAKQLTPDQEPSPNVAAGLYVIAMNVEQSSEAEFNAWYDLEHLPRLSAVPGVIRARRYVAVEGPHRYFAVYHLEDLSVVGSPAWLEAAETPWTHRMRQQMSDRLKMHCHLNPRVAPTGAGTDVPRAHWPDQRSKSKGPTW